MCYNEIGRYTQTWNCKFYIYFNIIFFLFPIQLELFASINNFNYQHIIKKKEVILDQTNIQQEYMWTFYPISYIKFRNKIIFLSYFVGVLKFLNPMILYLILKVCLYLHYTRNDSLYRVLL